MAEALALSVFPGAIAAGGISAIAATAVSYLAISAVTSYALSALSPSVGSGSASTNGLITNFRSSTEPREIVYGQVRKGGVITFMESRDSSEGEENKFLHFVVALASHEVEEIGDIYINDSVVTLDGSGYVTDTEWKDEGGQSKIKITKNLGGVSQVADPELVSETSVDSNFVGVGIAYLNIRLAYDNQVFSSGIPTFTAVVKGKKVYDPRTSTTAYSANSALCIRDYLISEQGMDELEANIDATSFVASANVCDEDVQRKSSSATTEKRYETNGVLSTGDTLDTNLNKLVTSCGGTLFWGQGEWQLKVGYFTPSVKTFTLDDVLSDISIGTRVSRRDNFNKVSGIFVSEQSDWVETEYTLKGGVGDAFVTIDGGDVNHLDLPLPMTTSRFAVQRLAKMALFRAREQLTFTAEFGLGAMEVQPGDTVSLTIDRYGWDTKDFEVLSWRMINEAGSIRFALTLKETSAAAYDWDADAEDLEINNTTLPSISGGLSIDNLSAVSATSVETDGTTQAKVQLSWDRAANAFVSQYVVEWKLTGDTEYSSRVVKNKSTVIGNLSAGQDYDFRVTAITVGGFVGASSSIQLTISGDAVAPGLPTSITTKSRINAVKIKWTNPTDSDLKYIEVQAYLDGAWESIALTGGSSYTVGDLTAGTYNFKLRSIDFTGNVSGFTSNFTGVARQIATADIKDNAVTNDQIASGAVEVASFASTIKPVEILSALPGAPHTEGRQVYLTTDNKLYRNTGSGWTNKLDAADVEGQITASQIAALEASKITGQLTDSQIADIAAAKVSGQLTNSQLADIASTKITGQLTNAQLAAIASTKITGTLTNAQLDAIAATKVTGTLVDSQIAAVAATKVTGQITSTQITDDAITTPKIAAGAIVASKIFVGDTSNMIPDSGMHDDDSWSLSSGFTLIDNAVSSVASGRVIRSDNTVSGGGDNDFVGNAVTEPLVELDEVGPLFASVSYRAFSTVTGSFSLWISFFDYSETLISETLIGEVDDPASGVSNRFADIVDPPANTAFVSIRCRRGTNPSGNTSGVVYFWSPQLRRASSGELIVDGAVVADKVAANAITTAKIATGAVTANEILAGTITADEIASNAITTVKIAANAVTANEILAGTITAIEIASNAITADKILAGTITAAEIATGTITGTNIAGATITGAKLVTGTITTDHISAGTIVGTDIAAGTISGANIAAGTIYAINIAAGTISADEILAGTITSTELAADSVIAGKIAAGAVSATELSVGLGGNLCYNGRFFHGQRGWTTSGSSTVHSETTHSLRRSAATYSYTDRDVWSMYQNGTSTTGYTEARTVAVDEDGTTYLQAIPVEAGKYYEASVQVATLRAAGSQVVIIWRNKDGGYVGASTYTIPSGSVGSDTDPNQWTRYFVKAQPQGTSPAYANLYVRHYGTDSGSSSFTFFHSAQFIEVGANSVGPNVYRPDGTTRIDGTGIIADSISVGILKADSVITSNLTDLSVENGKIGENAVNNHSIIRNTATVASVPTTSPGTTVASSTFTAGKFKNFRTGGAGQVRNPLVFTGRINCTTSGSTVGVTSTLQYQQSGTWNDIPNDPARFAVTGNYDYPLFFMIDDVSYSPASWTGIRLKIGSATVASTATYASMDGIVTQPDK